ncbi:MAG: glycosyltransferase family 4 protein [Bdellovibrionales bacterium]|nr:glycosyltransferase family 4 protein [Bdellovibrionales bacterium]
MTEYENSSSGNCGPAHRFGGKLLLLRLYRMGRLPSALYAASLLWEDGMPVVALEYGHFYEAQKYVFENFPRVRWASGWARWVPSPLRASAVWLVTLCRLFFAFVVQGRPRFIVAHGLQEQLLAYVIRIVWRVPYAVHVHEAFEYKDLSRTNKVFLAAEGTALCHADFLIFPESTRAAIYKKRYELQTPIYLAFNCPRRALPESGALPKELRLREAPVRALYVGGIGPNNALEHAVRALARFPELELCLVGWAEKRDKENLMRLAESLGVAHRTRLLGVVDEATKWALMRSSDISYCLYEPSTIRLRYVATASNKFMESLAAGLPVITNNCEGFKSLVEHYEVGVAVDDITDAGVQKAFRFLLADTERREAMGRRAAALHASEFNYETQFAPIHERLKEEFSRERKPRRIRFAGENA